MKRRTLDDRILRESGPDAERLTLWLPGHVVGKFRHWQRISEVPQTKFTVTPGFRAVAATAFEARQRIGGLLGRLAPLMGRRPSTGTAWKLPQGGVAEQFGPRQHDLLLVWTEDADLQIDEAWVKSQWPQSRAQRLGQSLYLVAGVQPPGAVAEAEQSGDAPRSAAEHALKVARDSGDVRRVAAAVADLGAVYLYERRLDQANQNLQEALRLATTLGDKSLESEVLCGLALLALAAGDPALALENAGQALQLARDAADRYGEKIALQRLGVTHVRMGAPARGIAAFEQALALARALRDHTHESDLLWYLAIVYAEMGQREQAQQHGDAAIEVMEQARNPNAAWFRRHLDKYRAGETERTLGSGADIGSDAFDVPMGGASTTGATPGTGTAQGPGLLRMAISASKAMTQFVGSGFKTAPGTTVQYRLRTCAACPHHTGLRCRPCGCFTSAKARMAHEMCPLGKWPAVE
jgi:tetratricopeptide (TPR) repeat protein